ncbi:hypothetical protein PsB1_0096 [Candidatus Phycosocius spiralis]|uniref:Uncharacterized protein n=1 Tax=Candidatus Phycosocius spiralis TaxID=2815099 RepID=A0ABQ4PSG0_9PROT|nr:hypothetical protein PsB1_0096 [Candidatus Phycosocius spiralis]
MDLLRVQAKRAGSFGALGLVDAKTAELVPARRMAEQVKVPGLCSLTKITIKAAKW